MPDDFSVSNAANRERTFTFFVSQAHFDFVATCSVQSFSRYLWTSTWMHKSVNY